MKKLSLLTVITAISCITLLVSCGQNRNSRYGFNNGGGYCSPQHYSGGQNQYGAGYNRGYNQQGGGYNQYGAGYNRGYNQQGGGYNQYGAGYDPTCTGGIQPYPTGRRFPDPRGCGMYGQGYHPAQHYTHNGNWCVQGGAGICFGTGGYCSYSVGSDLDETEITLLCNLNEQPDAACPRGLTCQEIGEGDTGICS